MGCNLRKPGRAVKRAAVLIILLGTVCACSMPARQENISTEQFQAIETFNATVAANVYGGFDEGSVRRPYPLRGADFERALVDSLQASRLFDDVVSSSEEADINLNVGLMQLIQPTWSGSISLESTWTFYDRAGTEISRKKIKSVMRSSFNYKKQVTERVATDTILQGLQWLQKELQEIPN